MFAKPFISLIIWIELLAFLSTCMMWLSNLIFSSKIIPSSHFFVHALTLDC
jgi:hypothetical protein